MITKTRIRQAADNIKENVEDIDVELIYHKLCGLGPDAIFKLMGIPLKYEKQPQMYFARPKIRRIMAVTIDRWLATEAASTAFGVLYSVATDARMPAGARVNAANSLLDRAGYDVKRIDRQAAIEKPVGDMSIADLEALIRDKEAQLRDISAGKIIDDAPNDEPMTTQEIDMYE